MTVSPGLMPDLALLPPTDCVTAAAGEQSSMPNKRLSRGPCCSEIGVNLPGSQRWSKAEPNVLHRTAPHAPAIELKYLRKRGPRIGHIHRSSAPPQARARRRAQPQLA